MQKGFTLIELLIVVAIIGILATVGAAVIPGLLEKTKITDVKVTLVNPTDVLPFDNLYHTSSANWNNWYNGTYDSASAFDDENIHSLENNLPLYIFQKQRLLNLQKIHMMNIYKIKFTIFQLE